MMPCRSHYKFLSPLVNIPWAVNQAFGEHRETKVKEFHHGVARTVDFKVARRSERASCSIHLPNGFGSGVLVDGRSVDAPEYCILTNKHVCHNAEEARLIKVVFNKVEGEQTIEVRLDPGKFFFARDSETPHDYNDACLCAVNANDVDKLRGWCDPVPLDEDAPIQRGDPLSIWQHPLGGMKCLAQWRAEQVLASGKLVYEMDTAGGSSGSPVYNNAMQLVAIHAFGSSQGNGGPLVKKIIQDIKSAGVTNAVLPTPSGPALAPQGDRVLVDYFGELHVGTVVERMADGVYTVQCDTDPQGTHTETPVPEFVTCPAGHRLKEGTNTNTTTTLCDGCGCGINVGKFSACRQCNYDLCSGCLLKARTTSTSAPSTGSACSSYHLVSSCPTNSAQWVFPTTSVQWVLAGPY